MKKLTIGISPCPNDTFIFEAIFNKRIDLEGFTFEFILEDVEQLNKNAQQGLCDVTKISYHAYTSVWDQYTLLNSGSALGRNCGPLLIAKEKIDPAKHDGLKVVIPGIMTTANLLLSIAYPTLNNKQEMIFHEIEDAVLNGESDLGLIIHENRFTYEDKGLVKIRDLGEYWEESTGYPIPLGGIAIKNTIKLQDQKAIDKIIRKSIEYAFAHKEEIRSWIRENAQEMKDNVIDQHIALYVNDFSVDLGLEGRSAVRFLYAKMLSQRILSKIPKNLFVER